jgi:hypothetical protein
MSMQPKKSKREKSIPMYTGESIIMPIMLLQRIKLSTQKKSSEKDKVLLELIAQSEIHVDSIITLDFVKIGTILDIVHSVTAVSICMIGQTIKLVGSNRKTFKELKRKDGEE